MFNRIRQEHWNNMKMQLGVVVVLAIPTILFLNTFYPHWIK